MELYRRFDTRFAASLYSAPTPRISLRRIAMSRPSLAHFAFTLTFAFATLSAVAPAQIHFPKLTPQNSGTTEGLIAVSPVNARVIWAAGRHGTFLVTTDGGATWKSGQVPGAKWLQFRGVRGMSATTAYLMSIGSAPGNFRIYKTEDGGATWTMQFRNELAGAFYDCFAFWSPTRGIAHSDSVNGVFPDIRTEDGTTWQSIADNMPPALSGEFSFSQRHLRGHPGRGQCLDCNWRRAHRANSGDLRRRRHVECQRYADREFAKRRRIYRGLP